MSETETVTTDAVRYREAAELFDRALEAGVVHQNHAWFQYGNGAEKWRHQKGFMEHGRRSAIEAINRDDLLFDALLADLQRQTDG